MHCLLALTLLSLFSGALSQTLTVTSPTATTLTTLNPILHFSQTGFTAASLTVTVCLKEYTGSETCAAGDYTGPVVDGDRLGVRKVGTQYLLQLYGDDGTNTATSAAAYYFTTPATIVAPVLTSPATNIIGQSFAANDITLAWTPSTTEGTVEYCWDTTTPCPDASYTSITFATTAQTQTVTAVTQVWNYWNARSCDSSTTPVCTAATERRLHASPPEAFDLSTPGVVYSATLPSTAVGKLANPTLTWVAAVGANSYDICLEQVADTDSAACTSFTYQTVSTTSFTVTTALTASTRYRWSVRASDGTGTTDATSTYFFATSPAAAFTKSSPAQNAGAESAGTGNSLNWAASNYLANYRVCYEDVQTTNGGCTTAATGSTWINVASTATTYSPTLIPGLQYRWQVQAYDGTAYTDADATTSGVWLFKTVGFFSLSDFASMTATAIYPSINFQWSGISGVSSVDSYDFCISQTAAGCSTTSTNWVDVGTATSKTIDYSLMSPSTTYYWHVRGHITYYGTSYVVYAGGKTAPTSFVTASLPSAFAKISPRSPSYKIVPSSAEVSWGASSNSNYYEVCYQVTGTATPSCTTFGLTSITTTSTTLPTLVSQAVYSWQVRAVGDGGITVADASATNPVWTFTTLPGTASGCTL